ncbi:hypothetical protein EES38_01595 [Vibrio viridaestus]|uniref:Uncharacterized protein n=1 Tax=Vibrio viridaestus TaxID=2487322 RepID=A0A3N9TKG8_9VIBR|nr:hypothetical protein EES38_01595 [Vibrio viridaestus]
MLYIKNKILSTLSILFCVFYTERKEEIRFCKIQEIDIFLNNTQIIDNKYHFLNVNFGKYLYNQIKLAIRF